MAQREFLRIVQETSFGTPNLTTGAPTTGAYVDIRLDQSNAFTMRPNRLVDTIPFGGGVNIDAMQKGDAVECRGRLSVLLCASQAKFLLDWAITRINSGRTTPWTTTDASSVMPPGDLASMSIYHGIEQWGGTVKRRRYGGAKVTSWELTGGEGQGQRLYRLNLELEAAQPYGNTNFGGSDSDPNSTEFPAPADADFPTDVYLWGHTAMTIGSSRTRIRSLTARGSNRMAPHRYNTPFLVLNYFTGREVTLQASNLLLASPDDRAAFEAQTAQDTSVVLDNGTVETTLDFNTANLLSGVDDELELADAYHRGLSLKNLYDVGVGGDQPDVSVAVA